MSKTIYCEETNTEINLTNRKAFYYADDLNIIETDFNQAMSNADNKKEIEKHMYFHGNYEADGKTYDTMSYVKTENDNHILTVMIYEVETASKIFERKYVNPNHLTILDEIKNEVSADLATQLYLKNYGLTR